jgi:asparagine synthetase B (glutamine-hydrolysing)
MDLCDPHTCWNLDLLGYWSANEGIEWRYPFLDVRLVRFMLSIPYQQRLLVRGRKEMLRKAVADLLPEPVVCRFQGPAFDTTKPRHIAPNLTRDRSLLMDGEWMSAPFVDLGGDD